MDSAEADDWSREWGASYGTQYLRELSRRSDHDARDELLRVGKAMSNSLDAASWEGFNRGFLRQTFRARNQFASSLAIADPGIWIEYSARLLQSDIDKGRSVDLRNEETVHQVLGILGKQLVFGVYHGNLTRLPRSVALRLLLRHGLPCLRTMILVGVSPVVVEIHLPKLRHGRFTEQLNLESHLQIAAFLRSNPAVRGVFNSNWYYDPAVGRISPKLAFLSRFASSHGAYLVALGQDANTIADATLRSGTRRAKFESGEYEPTRFARFWPSSRVIEWAAGVKGS